MWVIALAAAALAGLAPVAEAQTRQQQQQQRARPPAATPSRPPAAPTGKLIRRSPLPPAARATLKDPRRFRRCNRAALNRKLRGAERRQFVARCRLGYGFRLFRLRGPSGQR